jgi:hypothetical protein
MVKRLLVLLVMVVVLSACDTGSIAPPPTPVARSGFPTPYPPLDIPTDVPAPLLPAAIRQPTTPGAGQPAQSGAPAAVPTNVVQGAIQEQILKIERDAAKVRGLTPKVDVNERFVNSDGMRAEITALRDKNYTREQARLGELELWLLRFVDEPAIGLYQLQADLLAEQVAGLYVPDENSLYVLNSGDKLEPLAQETVAHEFVHSLQDQYFNLKQLLAVDPKAGDKLLAARSIVEGDATFSGLLYADEYMSRKDFEALATPQGDSTVLRSAPSIFQQELLFPYAQGVEFATNLYKRGGFQAINNALADPPHSTEQIMHPEKYLATPRDEPVPVGLAPLTGTLSAGWTYQDTSTIGEFELGVLLQDKNVPNPEMAASGWGGGQYDLYTRGTDSLVFMGTIWDTEAYAKRFETALRTSLLRTPRFQDLWTDGARYFTVERVGNRVFYAAGTDRTSVQTAFHAVK